MHRTRPTICRSRKHTTHNRSDERTISDQGGYDEEGCSPYSPSHSPFEVYEREPPCAVGLVRDFRHRALRNTDVPVQKALRAPTQDESPVAPREAEADHGERLTEQPAEQDGLSTNPV